MSTLEKVAAAAGVTLFDYQEEAISHATGQPGRERLCLYYRTGAGKTLTSLLALVLWGWDTVLVIAPPATHPAWEAAARKVGVKATCMSHAKFRQKGTKLSRHVPIIADEYHLFGGHGGKGWGKFERTAAGVQAPVIIASATPNYNDADRVYCIQRVLDPHSCKGGFLQFLYKNCIVEHNPFSPTPDVVGFINHGSAEEYLAALPGVAYVPDTLVWSITDVPYDVHLHNGYEEYGYDQRRHRIVASQMEDRHTRILHGAVREDGTIQPRLMRKLRPLLEYRSTPVLVYCTHSSIARALHQTIFVDFDCDLVTGDTSKVDKNAALELFRKGFTQVLIGTATLATGTDGLDKVCDRLIILDDTDDDSLRRQLVGRIMPRGEDSDASKKQVYRLLPQVL